MTEHIYKKVEEWCQQAVALLEDAGLSPKLADMTRQTIKRHSGRRALHEIAADLAEGLGDLPPNQRMVANNELIRQHGFGYEFFLDAKLKRAMRILGRGKVRNDDEFRELSAIANDTTISSKLADFVSALLTQYETAKARLGDGG